MSSSNPASQVSVGPSDAVTGMVRQSQPRAPVPMLTCGVRAVRDRVACCWEATAPTVSIRAASPWPRSAGVACTPAGARSRAATAHWYAVAATSVPSGTTPRGPATGSSASRETSGDAAHATTSSRARCKECISASRVSSEWAAITRPSMASRGSAVVTPSSASRRMSGRALPSGHDPRTTSVRAALRPGLRVGAAGSTSVTTASRSSQAPTVSARVPLRSELTRPRSPGSGARSRGSSVTLTSCRE